MSAVAPKRDKLRFNILVAGESGQGKTTFLKCLLRRYVNTNVGAMGTHFDSVVLKTEGVKVSVLGRYEIEFGATTEKMVLELEVFFFLQFNYSFFC